tara:strand:- start:2467 stop:2658 length:192 start_codon:yes stop_codon:yes gene_type:complete
MKVKATRLGFYGNSRIKEGVTFEIKSEEEFSEKWMEYIDKPKKKKKAKKESEGDTPKVDVIPE